MKKFSQANHLVGIHAQLETRKPTGLLHECKDLSTVKSTQYYKLKRAIRQFKLPQELASILSNIPYFPIRIEKTPALSSPQPTLELPAPEPQRHTQASG